MCVHAGEDPIPRTLHFCQDTTIKYGQSGSLVNESCGRSGQKRQIFFVYCLMPPLSIFGGYHLAPTAILDFQDGRHHIIISLLQRSFELLFLGLKIHFQGQRIQLCHLPKCQMVNYLKKGEKSVVTPLF